MVLKYRKTSGNRQSMINSQGGRSAGRGNCLDFCDKRTSKERMGAMPKAVLITGGAGFIGSELARELARAGHRVRVLDNLSEQVHGPSASFPTTLSRDIE